MKKKYLGDVYDHWKGSLIRQLNTANVLRDLAVYPMITDAVSAWKPDDFGTYAALLGINVNQILRCDREFNRNPPNDYFDVRYTGDLFVDPDTGIEPSRCGREHISISELNHLQRIESRLILVYQHSGRDRNSIKRLSEAIRKVHKSTRMPAVAYLCEHATMAFFGNHERLRNVYQCLSVNLQGDTATKRLQAFEVKF